MSFAAGDTELHHIHDIVLEDDMLALMAGEIDYYIGALGSCNRQLLEFNRCHQQSLVAADLHHRHTVGQQ